MKREGGDKRIHEILLSIFRQKKEVDFRARAKNRQISKVVWIYELNNVNRVLFLNFAFYKFFHDFKFSCKSNIFY